MFLSVFISILLYPLVPESPRWLLSVNKTDEANKIIRQISRIHKKSAPDIDLDNETGNRVDAAVSVEKEKISPLRLISRPGIGLTTAILCLNWLVVDFCYYGLSLQSVNLAGDIFTNFVLSALVELPAVVLGMLGMDWAGRVALLILCQILGGVSCILAGLLTPPWILPFSLLGKFSASVVFLIVYLYTAEIYPTQVRGMGLALTGTMARVGGFIAPYIAGLGVTDPSLPFLVFGISAIIGGLASVLLPETRGAKLPETVEDVERIVRDRSGCFSFNSRRRDQTNSETDQAVKL